MTTTRHISRTENSKHSSELSDSLGRSVAASLKETSIANGIIEKALVADVDLLIVVKYSYKDGIH